MKRLNIRTLALLLAALVILPCLPAPAGAAATALPDVRCVCGEGTVNLQREAGVNYLFLPSAADLHQLTLSFQGELTLQAEGRSLALTSETPFDLAALFPEEPADGVYSVVLRRGATALPVKLLHGRNTAALFITSQDPDQNLAWVEKSKNNKAKGSAVLLDPDGKTMYNGALKQIKGRGNSTWAYPKKPYQIKLDKAEDLMECGEPAKTWVLLANYYDRTLLRNRITYDLAEEMGLAYSPHSRPVDLYYDGEYRGSYQLSEKTEIGKNRVDLNDLDADFAAANPDVSDFGALPLISGQTEAGYPCQYVDGLQDPEKLDGGYLLEIDYQARAQDEIGWFSTPMGLYLVTKSPEYLSRSALRFISGRWQLFEDAVANRGTHPGTGQPYSDYMDKVSLARCYLLLELSMDGDAFRSSTYFYKPEGEEKLYAGPVWDFDTAYGLYYANYSPESLVAGKTVLGKALLAIPDFRQTVGDEEETFHHLVRDILLSDDPSAKGKQLRSLTSYDDEVAASRRMDLLRWPMDAKTHETQRTVADLRQILDRRETWMHQGMGDYSRFRDVKRTDWFAPSVEAAVQRGLFQGVGEDLFAPNDSMTRGMVTTVLYRMAGQPQTQGTNAFTDIPQEAWYAPAVSWAAENGVVSGYPDGTFLPNAPVSRQELVSLMYRYTASLRADVTAPVLSEEFLDRDQVPNWAGEAFAWAVDRGLVNGSLTEGGGLLLDPAGGAPRSQGAALFLRLLEYLEKQPAPPAEPQEDAQTADPRDSQGAVS